VLIFRPLDADIADIAVALSQSPVAVVDPADHGYLLSRSAARRACVSVTRDGGCTVYNGDTRRRRLIVAECHVTRDRRTSGFVGVSVSVCRPALFVLVSVLTVKVDERGDE